MGLHETLTFRAPVGTVKALADAARREGRKPSEIAREALAARLGLPLQEGAA